MKKILFTLAQTIMVVTSSAAQDTTHTERPEAFTYEASYIGDNVSNLSGGIKTGSCYLGMAAIRITFDTERADLWKGGSFYINGANTHGATPSADMIGDMQVVSNIDAGDHTYIQELWFKQTIKKVECTIGLQDINVEFANSENGAAFMNSSFGILPIISGNITPPIFPLTSLGLTAKWNVTDKISWLNALYDGSPTEFDYNPYNTKWEFNSGDGMLAITELQYSAQIQDRPGTYKIGGYTHNHIVEQSLDKTLHDSVDHTIFGIYAYADQLIWEKGHTNISLFTQFGYSPSRASVTDHFVSFGTNVHGLCSKEGNGVLGVAIAYEHIAGNTQHETAIELTYQYPLNTNIFIQPDVQYIINPVGTGEQLDNCLVANLRLGINF